MKTLEYHYTEGKEGEAAAAHFADAYGHLGDRYEVKGYRPAFGISTPGNEGVVLG